MSRGNRRKEALHLRQFNFHRKKELPRQLFFNDSIHNFMEIPVAGDGSLGSGKADKNAESSPYCTQQRGKARLPGRGIIAHRRPCCRRTHNRMYDDGHSTICRSDNHNEEGNSHSHRYISRSDGLNVPLKSS